MLERFHPKVEDQIRVPEKALRETVIAVFEKMKVPKDDARLGADVLVSADLRGVESHGVSNMLRSYVRGFQQGTTKPEPQWKVIRETPATASIDCDTGLGIIIAPKAMEIAIEKAKKVGLGMVTMKNGGHMGMASYHSMLALKHDMIGLCMTATPPEMVPTFGAEPRLGTNPIALAAPADKEAPFVYDAATTVVAGNKLGLARRLGVNLPAGWVADATGTPIMEETMPPTPGAAAGPGQNRLLPVGSNREMGSHKGYGLACVVEILSGILTGGGFGAMGRRGFNHCVAAYNIEAFMDTAEFKKTMDEFLQTLKNTKPAAGYSRVLYAGLPEAESEIEHRKNGIPLHREVVDWFHQTCKEMAITCKF